MATGFDPYYKWLGIPQADQPPHHYRLLGIELFESDGQVIESAADRQMTYLRTFQAGPHSELSQRLLNELSAARLCLLKPEKKAEYDAWLRGRLAARAASPAVPAAAPPVLMPRMPMPSYTVPPISGPVTPVPGPLASMPVVPGPAYSAPLPKDLGLLQPYAGYRPRRPRNRVLPLVLTAVVALGAGWFLLTFVLSLPAFRSDPAEKTKKQLRPSQSVQEAHPHKHSTGKDTDAGKAKTPANTGGTKALGDGPSSNPPGLAGVPRAIHPKPIAAVPEKVDDPSADVLPSANESIDLLKRIDARRDAISGVWTVSNGQLASPFEAVVSLDFQAMRAQGGPRLQIPFTPSGRNYRLTMEVTRLAGTGSLVVGLIYEDQQRLVMVDARNHNFMFPRADGATSVSQRQWQMVSGSPASLSFVVGPGMLRIESDGWLLYDSKDPAALSFWQSWLGKQQPALTLGGFGASFRFTRLSIQNLDRVPPAPPNAPVRPLTSAPAANVDLGPQAVPAEEARNAALQRLKQVFKADYPEAVEPGQRLAFAQKLARQAETGTAEPAAQYVMLEEASQYAAAGGELRLAMQFIASLVRKFRADEATLQYRAFAVAAELARSSVERAHLVTQLTPWIESAAEAEHYNQANDLLLLALDLAQKSKNNEQLRTLRLRGAELRASTAKWEAAESAKKRLADNSKDEEAHLALGQYLCLVRQDWAAGLTHLAQGSDKKLREAAQRDLEKPEAAADQVVVGDAWWAIAESTPPPEKSTFRQRAIYWYEFAAPESVGAVQQRLQAKISKYKVPDKDKFVPLNPASIPIINPVEARPLNPIEVNIKLPGAADAKPGTGS